MFRRFSMFLPAVLVAIALPATPALAGGGDGDESGGDSARATLRASQGCVSGERTKAKVSGTLIESVAFYVDGKRIKTVTRSDAGGNYSLSMACAHLRVGAHRAKAVVTFEEDASPSRKILRFQITRSPRGTPRFAG